MPDKPIIAVGPGEPDLNEVGLKGPVFRETAKAAVVAGGGVVGDLAHADALVWTNVDDVAGLGGVLADHGVHLRWVQLPWAGVERFAEAGLLDADRIWTCAKGSYAEPVAEHALALLLAGFRMLPYRARASTWTEEGGKLLHGSRIVILGGGGIATVLTRLLQPFGVDITIVRRHPTPVAGSSRTVGVDQLHSSLEGADALVIAASLTEETKGIVGAKELGLLADDAWVVNVGRGRHIVTDELVDALKNNVIGGAAMDVTDPEPLPDGHPLWSLPCVLVTPHTADTTEMVCPLFAERIEENVRRFINGASMVGVIDAKLGY